MEDLSSTNSSKLHKKSNKKYALCQHEIKSFLKIKYYKTLIFFQMIVQ